MNLHCHSDMDLAWSLAQARTRIGFQASHFPWKIVGRLVGSDGCRCLPAFLHRLVIFPIAVCPCWPTEFLIFQSSQTLPRALGGLIRGPRLLRFESSSGYPANFR